MPFFKWTEIEGFYNVRREIAKYPEICGSTPRISYRAKVKLHGTNAAIQITSEGDVFAQKRTSIITPERDNQGFATWVNHDKWRQLRPNDGTLIVYGEWCGPGIMKGTAVSKLPTRVFAVFGVRHVNESGLLPYDRLVDDPESIRRFLLASGLDASSNVYVIDWFNEGERFVIDWSKSADELAPVTDRINAVVADIDVCDPWVLKTFGVTGVGEGLVFYPLLEDHFEIDVSYKYFSDMCFKAKGERHKIVDKTKPAQADPTVVASVKEFAELVVTSARLEQALTSVGSPDVRQTGPFLKWIHDDIVKECVLELEASGLDAKVALRACADRARAWFIEQTRK